MAGGQQAEALLAGHRLGQGNGGGRAVELEGVLAPLGAARVVAVEGPAAGGHRQALLLHAVGHGDAVGDAVGIGQDQRRARIALGLQEGADGVLIAGAHRHAGHVHRAVGDRHQAQVFLGGCLAAGGELGHRPERCGLGGLAAGVGVHLGVEHQGVHIAAAGEHMVEAAEADVVSPAIASHQPDAGLHQGIGDCQQPGGGEGGAALGRLGLQQGMELTLQILHPPALGVNGGLVTLVVEGGQDRRRQSGRHAWSFGGHFGGRSGVAGALPIAGRSLDAGPPGSLARPPVFERVRSTFHPGSRVRCGAIGRFGSFGSHRIAERPRTIGRSRSSRARMQIQPQAGQAPQQGRRHRPLLIQRHPHPETELGVVLEQRIAPGRTATRRIRAPGGGGQIAAIDRAAAGGIGHHHPVAEELAGELEIGRFAAAGAGAGEREEGLLQLLLPHLVEVQGGAGHLRQAQKEVPVVAALLKERFQGGHHQGAAFRFAAVAGGAHLHAQLAAGAVLHGHLEREALAGEGRVAGGNAPELRRRRRQRLGGRHLGADRRVGAHHHALAALHAQRALPLGHRRGNGALLPTAGARWPGAVGGNGAHRQRVAAARQQRGDHLAHEGGGASQGVGSPCGHGRGPGD